LSARVYCAQNGLVDKDATWYGGRPRPKRHCVRWGPSSPSPKRRQCPPFSAHVYCGQTAVWIKMLLGMNVDLGPGHIVLDGNPAPLPRKGDISPSFGPCLLWPNGWMDQDATWYKGRPRPRPHCVTWEPRSPPIRGTVPQFWRCLLRSNGRPSQLLLNICPLAYETRAHILSLANVVRALFMGNMWTTGQDSQTWHI